MAEYIDRDELLKELCTVSAPTPSESWIVEKCIEKANEQPTADVVPKSEVEKIFAEIEEYLTKERNEAKDFDARMKIKGNRYRFYEGANFYLESAVQFVTCIKKKYTESENG